MLIAGIDVSGLLSMVEQKMNRTNPYTRTGIPLRYIPAGDGCVKELLCSENYSTFTIDHFVPSKS